MFGMSLRSWLAVRGLISANDDGDQTGNLRDSSSEEGLEIGKSGIERRSADLSLR